MMRIGSLLWRLAIYYLPERWRMHVLGYKELRAFVDEWMAAPPDVIGKPAALPPPEEDVPTEDEGATVMMAVPTAQTAPVEVVANVPTRRDIAYRHLGGNGISAMRLRFVLQCVGSFTRALWLVHRDRELTWDEKVRFATHAQPAGLVDWPHIASGTLAALSALYMIPQGVEE